ncbi:MAG TPA: desulfoferrodoxin [Clostridiales bacterium]|nr:desulfoferrodoxin [Clostridiales bacterium]
MSESKFYLCKHCKNIVSMLQDSGVNIVCCGDDMTLLKANTEDASNEKHVPVVSVVSNTVKVDVGSVLHPMEDKHFIQWIYLETKDGGQIKYLKPGEAPKATFALNNDDEVVAVYEYCNLHGLWKTVI